MGGVISFFVRGVIERVGVEKRLEKRKKNGVFSVWRRDCLIAGVPLKNAARWVALGYLARSFAKSFRLVAFEGGFLFLDGAFGVERFCYFVSFSQFDFSAPL